MRKLVLGFMTLVLCNIGFAQTSCEEARALAIKQLGDWCANNNYCEPTPPPNEWCVQCSMSGGSVRHSSSQSGINFHQNVTVKDHGNVYFNRYTTYVPDCAYGENPSASKNTNDSDAPACIKGSIVRVESQTLAEAVQVVGASFDIYYYSGYMKGRSGDFTFSATMVGTAPRDHISSFSVVTLKGNTQVDSASFINNSANQIYSYTWDGQDASSQESLGTETFRYIVTEHSTTGSLPIEQTISLGHFNAKLLGLGGWLPSIYRYYDSKSKTMYAGTGDFRRVEAKAWSTSGFYIAEEDGSVVYYFNSTGRHVYTKSGLTGAILYEFSYDGQGRLGSIEEPFGRTTLFNRNLSGQLISITAPKGQVTTVTLDVNGYLASITSPNNETYFFTYSGVGGLMVTYEKPGAQISTFTWDSEGNLTQDEHSGGYFFNIVNNIKGVKYQVVTPLGRVSTYNNSYGDDFFGSQHILSTGETRAYSREKTSGDSESLSENLTTATASYVDDARFGSMARFGAGGSLQAGSVYYTYSNTQSIALTDPNDPFSISTYSVQSQKGALDITTAYNPSTKKFTTTTGVGRTSETEIDTYERVVSQKRGNLYPFVFTYTNENLTKIAQNTRETNLAYNPTTGFLSSITNPLSQVTGFTYDSAGRVTVQTLPDLRVVGYSYDTNGNLTGITPPSRPLHAFGFNSSELPNSYAPPTLSGVSTVNTSYAYNDDKQLTQILKPTGSAIDFTYNATTGVLETVTTSVGDYVYTMNSGNGLPSSIVAPASGPIMNINYAGTIPVQYTIYNSSWSQISDYTANLSSDGTLGSDVVTGASATSTINYLYDNDEVLKKAGDFNLTYNTPNGQLTGATLGTGTTGFTDTYTYNSYGEMDTYTAKRGTTTIYSLSLGRDGMGRINSKSEFMNATTNAFAYTFDTTGRLTQTDKNSTTVATYGYDANSNRNSGAIGAQTTTATYNDQDWMTAYNTLTFAYNANGDLTSRTNTTTSTTTNYVYDVFGNLTQVTLPGGSTVITYEVDALNRRIGKKVNGVLQKRWVYMDQTRIAAELNSSGGITKRFIYGSKRNVPDYMLVGSTKYRIISDHLGSVRLVVKQSDGSITQRMNHDEFGRVTEDTNPGYLPFGFAGGLYDHQTGLVRFGVRDYDAETGRWTSKDPILFGGGDANLFGYVMQDPVNFIDPLGLQRGGPFVITVPSRTGPFNPGPIGPPSDQGPLDPTDFCDWNQLYCPSPPFGRVPRSMPKAVPSASIQCLVNPSKCKVPLPDLRDPNTCPVN